jgi:FixJ family two-component response regulator
MPVIFMTVHGTIPKSVRAMKAGAVDFLEKPFEDQAFLDLVKNSIELDKHNKNDNAEKNELLQRFESLTSREKEVFALVISGKLNKQTAFQLGISEKTVKVHRANVMQKMRADSLADLVRISEKLPKTKVLFH